MHERFHILAAKVLAGEASSNEKAELEQLLSANSELRVEFDELQSINKTLTDFAPLAAALDSGATPISAEHRRQFEKAYQEKFGRASQEPRYHRHPIETPAGLVPWIKAQYARILLAVGAAAVIVMV